MYNKIYFHTIFSLITTKSLNPKPVNLPNFVSHNSVPKLLSSILQLATLFLNTVAACWTHGFFFWFEAKDKQASRNKELSSSGVSFFNQGLFGNVTIRRGITVIYVLHFHILPLANQTAAPEMLSW